MENRSEQLGRVVKDVEESTKEIIEKFEYYINSATDTMVANMLLAGVSGDAAEDTVNQVSEVLITAMSAISGLHMEAALNVVAELVPDGEIKDEFKELIKHIGLEMMATTSREPEEGE